MYSLQSVMIVDAVSCASLMLIGPLCLIKVKDSAAICQERLEHSSADELVKVPQLLPVIG